MVVVVVKRSWIHRLPIPRRRWPIPRRRWPSPPRRGQAMGCMCRCAPPRILTSAPPPPTSLTAARPPSLLPPPFRADGDPPFYALAGERKGRPLFVYSQHKLSYPKNTFSGGHKPSFRWSRALPGLLTSPPPFLRSASTHSPQSLCSLRDRHSMAFNPRSRAFIKVDFSWEL